MCSVARTENADFSKDTKHNWRWLRKLTPDEAVKVRTAYQAAMKDPVVRAAKHKRDECQTAYHVALHAAMVRSDPSVGQIIRKIPDRKKHNWSW